MITKTVLMIPIYDHNLEVIVFDKWDDLQDTKYWKLINDEYPNGVSGLTIDYSNISKNTILIPKGNLEILVHELVHVKNNMFKRKHLEHSDEHEAYIMEYMFSKCKNLVLRKKVK